jgi:hypothetical protein
MEQDIYARSFFKARPLSEDSSFHENDIWIGRSDSILNGSETTLSTGKVRRRSNVQRSSSAVPMRQSSQLLLIMRFRLSASSPGGLAFLDSLRRGTELSRFRIRCLQLVLPFLAAEHKQMHVNMASELLRLLSGQRARQWQAIVMLDESWLDLRRDHDLMAHAEIVPHRNRHTIRSQTHADSCAESERILGSEGAVKGKQIQRRRRYK